MSGDGAVIALERVRRDPDRLHRRRVAVAAAGMAIAVVVDVVTTSTRRLFDLRVYTGAVRAWAAGGNLYDYVRPGSHFGFTYPPFAGLVMAPMTVLPWRVIVVAQAVITAAAAAVVVAWLTAPLARRWGWPLWVTVPAGLAVLVALAPVRDVVGYGQVNLMLVGLVAADVGWGVARGRWYGGIGIGLAAAIKLVPGLFVVYLLLTRRYRAAVTAAGTAAAATGGAGIVAPRASVDFWLYRCWEIGRVGDPASAYNQSLRGGLLRLGPYLGSGGVWCAGCAVVLVIWAWRVRDLSQGDHLTAGDDRVGVALTGVAACLISPITWVHHLVWILPALAVTVEAGAFVLAGSAGALLACRVTSMWADGGWFARAVPTNAYVWLCAVLLMMRFPDRAVTEDTGRCSAMEAQEAGRRRWELDGAGRTDRNRRLFIR